MSRVRELAREIKEREEPIVEDYERLLAEAARPTEKRLAALVQGYQRFQLRSLDLFQTEVPDRFAGFGSIRGDGINVRRGPGGKEASLFKVDRETPVIIKEVRGLWVEVRFADGREGFIFKDYVRVEASGG